MPETLHFIWEEGKAFLLPDFPDNERLHQEVKDFLTAEHSLVPGHWGAVRLDFFGTPHEVHIRPIDTESL